MTQGRLTSIPALYAPHWERVKTPPPLLTHFTTAANKDRIFETGRLAPFDPAPGDWPGLTAVFMCDPDDPSFPRIFKTNLAPHFFSKSDEIHELKIRPHGELWRCTTETEGSYYICLHDVPAAHVISSAFSFSRREYPA